MINEKCSKCFWNEISICNGEENICPKFIGEESPGYKGLHDEFQREINNSINIIREKWEGYFYK